MVILLFIIGYLFLLVVSVRVVQSPYAPREMERRLRTTSRGHYSLDEMRYLYNRSVDFARWTLGSVLLVIFTLLIYANYGLWVVCVLVLLAIILRVQSARYLGATRLAKFLYAKREKNILKLMSQSSGVFDFLLGRRSIAEHRLGSREELNDLITQAQTVLSAEERQLLLASLNFNDKVVYDYMTPSDEVTAVAADEMVGPLVLDDLFKTKAQVFPVIEGSLDRTVGVLEIKELFTLRNKKSHSARDLMTSGVSAVEAQQDMLTALRLLLSEGSRLAIVVDRNRKAVGMITLVSLIERLIGESHDSAR